MLNKLLQWGLLDNTWGWFHALAGGALAKLFMWIEWEAVWGVLVIAILWEIYEYIFETGMKPAKIYGSMERFLYDAFGDIVLAVACAALVVI